MNDDPIGPLGLDGHLVVDAHDWTRPVTDVALSAQGALGHHRRVEEIKEMGPPSMEWEPAADEPTGGAQGAVATLIDVPARGRSDDRATDEPASVEEEHLPGEADAEQTAGRQTDDDGDPRARESTVSSPDDETDRSDDPGSEDRGVT